MNKEYIPNYYDDSDFNIPDECYFDRNDDSDLKTLSQDTENRD